MPTRNRGTRRKPSTVTVSMRFHTNQKRTRTPKTANTSPYECGVKCCYAEGIHKQLADGVLRHAIRVDIDAV